MIQRTNLVGTAGASFSECERYRYTLWRSFGHGDYVNFLMLNPSTATELDPDPTVERCIRRTRSWGCGGLIVSNLFAYRATDPQEMKAQRDPIGPENDAAIVECAAQSAMVVCAWGAHGSYLGRSKAVLELLAFASGKLRCLKVNSGGEPAHPLYLPYGLEPMRMPCLRA